MKTLNVALLVSVILVAGALVLPLSYSLANADTICKFTKSNQRCDLDIEKLNGPFKLSIVNEQNNNNTGGGGGGGTVDQQARDDIAANGALDAQNVVRADGITSNVTALQGLVATQAADIQQLRTDLQTLNASVITGISLSNGSVVVTPPVDNGTVTPPVDNGTVINPPDNGTVVIPPDNGTVVVVPPVDNGTVIVNDTGPPADNSTGNLTG